MASYLGWGEKEARQPLVAVSSTVSTVWPASCSSTVTLPGRLVLMPSPQFLWTEGVMVWVLVMLVALFWVIWNPLGTVTSKTLYWVWPSGSSALSGIT